MDINKELSIPKTEQFIEDAQESDIFDDSDANVNEKEGKYSTERVFINPLEKKILKVTRLKNPNDLMIKKLKTGVAKGLALQGKISLSKTNFYDFEIGPGDKKTSSVIKKRFEQSKDYKIILEMMTDLNSVDQFRTIQKNEFLTRNPFEDNDVMTGEVDHYLTEEESAKRREEIFTIHQKAYIKHCKEL